MQFRDIVAIGGSAGAVQPLKHILRSLPEDFGSSLFVVLHLDPVVGSIVPRTLARESRLPTHTVRDRAEIRPGCVYFPVVDHHLVVKLEHVLAVHGPHENLWRPAIDVLFRSAAVAYGSRVVAILLSGNLDDGTAGLQAVKACGGVSIIQDPAHADSPGMLETAAASVAIDHCAKVEDIPSLLMQLCASEAPAQPPVPEWLVAEAAYAEPEHRPEQDDQAPSIFSCPECGGPLWEQPGSGLRFRCLVGHSYRGESLLRAAGQECERALWAAVRMFEQRMRLHQYMAADEAAKGRDTRARIYRERSVDSSQHAERLRVLLRRLQTEV